MRPGWFYLVIPYYIIRNSLLSFVPLYILSLGGNVVHVGLAMAGFSLMLIPSSVISGKLADATGRRRPILLASYAGQLLSTLAMAIFRSVEGVIAALASYSFFSALAPPVFGLLLMETLPKELWGEGNSISFQYMIYGYILGLLPGIPLLLWYPLDLFILVPLAASSCAIPMSLKLVAEPRIALERRALTLSLEALLHRLVLLPSIYIRVPRPWEFKRAFKGLGHRMTSDVPIIMLSASLFFLAVNLFFTSFIPFLKSNGLSHVEVISLYLFMYVVNAIASIRRLRERSQAGDVGILVEYLSLRAIAFMFGALAAAHFSGRELIYSTLFLFLLVGISFTHIYVGYNSLLFKHLPRERQGGLLGVYSALTNLTMFLGSLASGYISYSIGYFYTFFLASVVVFLASIMLEWHFKPHREELEEFI